MVKFIRKPLEGIFALTPLAVKPGTQEIDYGAIKENIEWLHDNEMEGFIAFGCMGQHHGVNDEEFNKVVDASVDATRGSQVCVIGTTAPNTKEAIRRTRYAEDAGADGVMNALPYGYSMIDEMAAEHYKLLNESIKGEIAIMAYNTLRLSFGYNISPLLWKRHLLKMGNIKALKESNGDLVHRSLVLQTIADKVNVFSGAEHWFWHDSQLGAKGVVGSAVWAAPKVVKKFVEECKKGNQLKPWTLKVYKKLISPKGLKPLVRPWGALTPPWHATTDEHGYFNALVEIGGNRAGPPRKPYLPLPREDHEALRGYFEELKAIAK